MLWRKHRKVKDLSQDRKSLLRSLRRSKSNMDLLMRQSFMKLLVSLMIGMSRILHQRTIQQHQSCLVIKEGSLDWLLDWTDDLFRQVKEETQVMEVDQDSILLNLQSVVWINKRTKVMWILMMMVNGNSDVRKMKDFEH